MLSFDVNKRLRDAENWVLSPKYEAPHRSRWVSGLHRAARIGYAVIRDVANGILTLHAMSLVYTTLLSIVPLLALSFSVLKAMDVHERLTPFVYQFFEPLGDRGPEIAEQVLNFVDNVKVGVLGSVGLAVLVYTVVSLVQKIEVSFNMIWRVPDIRSVAQRFSNYLSVIMIGPLLMVSAIGVSATVFSSDFVQSLLAIEPLGSLFVILSKLMPFLLVVVAFTFVYVFIPNTQVKLGSALLGGVIAGVLWQGGGVLFATFVVGTARYEAIYSSFAIGIILLIWLYVSWLILLVGSSIAFYNQHPSSIARRREPRSSPELEERVALGLMCMVGRAFDRGERAPQQEWLEERLRIPGEITRKVSDKLLRRGILSLAGVKGDQLVPGRSLDQITIAEVLAATRADEDGLVRRLPDLSVPDTQQLQAEPLQKTLAELVR
ncbi:YihY/virulence factor BrkB family protein [Hydrocarboniclastica marina]|uniref:YihY family inner membrane protein n=1 Tax=Hydrocarboniclastica marina TaxID=2259620 RepID=A0A4V1D8F8_9ALTE|nr:YihY/virulence factor BrkB family protein [Hydrocarboniclastica marina]MAL99550.1 ribonuclease BN [Alteromonadaceae bacterium]QCF25040.1 YihY family inner membrane protein [Hydrocarboniclastica marina]